MSPLVAYHSTTFRHRASIQQRGLLAGKPMFQRIFGVYVFRNDHGHPTRMRGARCVWGWDYPNDLWRVAYIGPLSEDRYVENGLVLHQSIPPQHITLITPIIPES